MASWGKVVGGEYMNATISPNRKGELALNLGFKRTPNLTGDAVGAWQEILPEKRGGASGAVSKMGQAVARVSLPGVGGKAAAAAFDSAVELAMTAPHTIRVDWIDGKVSLIQLPDKLFQHLAILLKDRQIPTEQPAAAAAPVTSAPPGMIEQIAKLAGVGVAPAAQPDVTDQIAKLAALRDQGALTEEEFAAKKAELLDRI
jgi:hypothetical protein